MLVLGYSGSNEKQKDADCNLYFIYIKICQISKNIKANIKLLTN